MRTDCTVAIMIDGAFFTKRYLEIYPLINPKKMIQHLYDVCLNTYLEEQDFLYRILYYDCEPCSKEEITKRLKETLKGTLNKKDIYSVLDKNFNENDFAFNKSVLEELKKTPKVALVLGRLKLSYDEDTRKITFQQKGVDMRIGLDIASVALKSKVQRIILVTGDSDFTPAIKFARREGLEVVLDHMGGPIYQGLIEHTDRLIEGFD